MLTYFVTMALAVGAAAMSGIGRRTTTTDSEAPSEARATGTAKLLALVAGGVLTFVAAFRWRVGVDYSQYASNYLEYSRLAWGDLELTREPGIRAIAKLSVWIKDDYATMFAIASLITVGLTVRTIYKNSDMFAYSLLIYVISTSWQGSFNGVRQYIACAILFAGHTLILERRLGRYALVVGIASLFHISALVGLLLYWVPRGRLGLMRTALLIGLAVAVVSAYDVLGGVFDWVKQEDVSAGTYFEEQVNPLRIVAAFAPLVVYVAFTDKSRLQPAQFFYVNMLLVNAAILLASSGSAYVARFSLYTSIYLTLALPGIFKTKDQHLGRILPLLTAVAYFAFWYLETTIEPALSSFRWVFDR